MFAAFFGSAVRLFALCNVVCSKDQVQFDESFVLS
jgi:hypothetical protein